MDEYLRKILTEQDGLAALTRQAAPEAPEMAAPMRERGEAADGTKANAEEAAVRKRKMMAEVGQAAARAAAARQERAAEKQKSVMAGIQEQTALLAAEKTAEKIVGGGKAEAAAKNAGGYTGQTPFLYAGEEIRETELSMQSVSRFFERDARRYG